MSTFAPSGCGTPASNEQRFAISFDFAYRLFSSALLISPADSYLGIANGEVRVRMGWAFRARFPVTAVAGVELFDRMPLSRGVHGFAGRWLVNGSGDKILTLHLLPMQRGYVLGVPVRLRELLISFDDISSARRALTAHLQTLAPGSFSTG